MSDFSDKILLQDRDRPRSVGRSLSSVVREGYSAILHLRSTGRSWSAIADILYKAEPAFFPGGPPKTVTLSRIFNRTRKSIEMIGAHRTRRLPRVPSIKHDEPVAASAETDLPISAEPDPSARTGRKGYRRGLETLVTS